MNYIKRYWIFIFIVFIISALIKPAFCFLILGSIVFYMGIDAIRFLKGIRQKGVECTGKILSFNADSDGHKTPVVEFKPIGGAIITQEPFVYSSTDLSKIRSYEKMIDKEVLVLYDPDDPARFILSENERFDYFSFSLFILGGLVFIVISICSFLGYIPIE